MPSVKRTDLNIHTYTDVDVMYMDICTIRLHKKTKGHLDRYREYRNESYDEVVMKLVGIVESAKKEPALSSAAIKDRKSVV